MACFPIKENCYTVFLEIIKSAGLNNLKVAMEPKIILTDFELAAMKSIKNAFPTCLNKLCFFHLNQSIYRHIQKAKLATRYNSDPSFAHKMRHIGALAFLEPTKVVEAFDILKNDILPEEAIEVTTWFDKYYINGSTKITKSVSSLMTMKRRQPTFPPLLWSVHDNVLSYIPLSQNALESWHNRWNTLLNRKKWNVYKTIDEFKKQ